MYKNCKWIQEKLFKLYNLIINTLFAILKYIKTNDIIYYTHKTINRIINGNNKLITNSFR